MAAYPFLKPAGLMGRWERWRMLAAFVLYFNVIRKSITTLMTDYATRFSDPLLRDAFNHILYEYHPAFPVLPFYFQLASHANGTAGVPEGVRSGWRGRSRNATGGSAARSPTTPRSTRCWSRTTGPWASG
ncbi:hypothetical protein SHKM778_57030 [Streptomyces sp. KM77-8]|uniref:Uncharacterized protein n=1 Tax=Streptomyces haneummycinicus TaxID=3074435 RepID=A0AAT9HNY2_9ACTN